MTTRRGGLVSKVDGPPPTKSRDLSITWSRYHMKNVVIPAL